MKLKLPDSLSDRLSKPKLSMDRLRRRSHETKINQALENLPRITNETVAEHREEMLSSARRFIYPLTHSRQRIVKVSVTLAVVGLVVFVGYVLTSLYKVQSSSSFIYGVTRVLPLPVAKAGDSWVSYESYLFELRHLKHYYETQQEVNFSTDSGRAQLQDFKKQAMDTVITDAYVKQLAAAKKVTVSDGEVDEAVRLLRDQNRLGNSDAEFADVLKEFWGWNIDDFRRELKQQLLAQKVVSTTDTTARSKADSAYAQLKGGADFAAVAKQSSDDAATRDNGGEYSFLVDRGNRDVAPKVVDALFHLQTGQYSEVIDTGYTLEIVKAISTDGGKVRAAHISVNFRTISAYVKPLQDKEPAKRFIKID